MNRSGRTVFVPLFFALPALLIEAFSSQKVSADIAKNFDSNLSAPGRDAIGKKGLSLHLVLLC